MQPDHTAVQFFALFLLLQGCPGYILLTSLMISNHSKYKNASLALRAAENTEASSHRKAPKAEGNEKSEPPQTAASRTSLCFVTGISRGCWGLIHHTGKPKADSKRQNSCQTQGMDTWALPQPVYASFSYLSV